MHFIMSTRNPVGSVLLYTDNVHHTLVSQLLLGKFWKIKAMWRASCNLHFVCKKSLKLCIIKTKNCHFTAVLTHIVSAGCTAIWVFTLRSIFLVMQLDTYRRRQSVPVLSIFENWFRTNIRLCSYLWINMKIKVWWVSWSQSSSESSSHSSPS